MHACAKYLSVPGVVRHPLGLPAAAIERVVGIATLLEGVYVVELCKAASELMRVHEARCGYVRAHVHYTMLSVNAAASLMHSKTSSHTCADCHVTRVH